MTPITPVRVSLYDILYQVTLPIVPLLADNTGLSICQSRLGLTLGLQNILCALLAYNQNHTGDEVIKKLLHRQGIKELRKYPAMNLLSMQAVHAQGSVIFDVLFLQNGHVIQSQQYIADTLHISTERSRHLLSLIAHVCLKELAVLVEHSKINGEELSELLDLQPQFLQSKRFEAFVKSDKAIQPITTSAAQHVDADDYVLPPKFSQVWYGMTGLTMPVAEASVVKEAVLKEAVSEKAVSEADLAKPALEKPVLTESATEKQAAAEIKNPVALAEPALETTIPKKQATPQKNTLAESSSPNQSADKMDDEQETASQSDKTSANNYAKAIGRGQDKQKEGGLAPLVSFGEMQGITLPQKRWLVQFAQVVDVYLKKNPLKINSTPKTATASSFRSLTGLGSEATSSKEEKSESDLPIDYDSPSRFGKNSAMIVVVIVIGILSALAMLKYKNTQSNITDINHLPDNQQTDNQQTDNTQGDKRPSQDIAIIRVDESESADAEQAEQSGKNKTHSSSKADKQSH